MDTSPRVLHPWPRVRFDATHPRYEPHAVVPLVGSVREYQATGIPTATQTQGSFSPILPRHTPRRARRRVEWGTGLR